MEILPLKPLQEEHGLPKQIVIVSLVAVVTFLHFVPLPGQIGLHFVHRELFFFPLLLAAFWFGLKGGLLGALVISAIYALHFASAGWKADITVTVGSQVLVFMAVGFLLGWMVERQERRRRERDFVRDTFGQYVPEELREQILGGHIPLDGEFKEATILFADLRDFTALVEKTAPRTVVQLINRYFKEMSEVIRLHDGLVLQFIGDEIEAVFGAPLSVADHADRAVQAASAMRRRLELLNAEWAQASLGPLRHGIGIHTGKVLAGNIGSPELRSYAMVGEAVNLTARIQDLNKAFHCDILISAATYGRLGVPVEAVKLSPVHVKGIERAVEVYRLL